MEFQFYTTIIISLLLLFFYCFLKWKKSNRNKKHPVEPSGSWPIIGHMHLLGVLPHISLSKLADKYGPIFMIRLGIKRALVISSHKMAKECFGTNDRVFINRPHTVFVEHLAYNAAMQGFSPYGPYWRDMRKITTVELLSNQRVEMLKHVRISELRLAIQDIYENRNKQTVVDMKQWFNDISLNSSVRLIVGKSLKDIYQGEKYNKVCKSLRDFFELAGAFVPADALPFLRRFDIGGYEKMMKMVKQEIDQVAEEWLAEHKTRKDSEKQGFMDALLGLYQSEEERPRTNHGADTVIKANCITLILAATDTTAVALTWALSLLLNNREVMKTAQAEIDNIVGKERRVNDSDIKDLIYLEAVLKETLRLYPPGPLSVPRLSVEDCTVNSCHIPAGTTLFLNLYKMHRDPEVWPNPLEYHPERFLTTHKDYDVRGKNFAYLPFGTGRRICPGITFALKLMMLTLATLLQGFEISTPLHETVDMSEGFGITNLKATPLNVILVPRLHDSLYDPQAVTFDN